MTCDHDPAVYGRTREGRCRRCRANYLKARRAKTADPRMKPCVHHGDCQMVRTKTGARYCAVQRRMSARNPGLVAELRSALTRDGWEDEFGLIEPLPPGYIDWVVEYRNSLEGSQKPSERRERLSSGLRSSVEGSIGAGGPGRTKKAFLRRTKTVA